MYALLCFIVVLIVSNILCLHCNELIPIFSFLLFLGKCEAYILPVFTCLVSSLCIVMHLAMFGTTGLSVPLFFPSLCSGLDCCVVQMCRCTPCKQGSLLNLLLKHISKGSDSDPPTEPPQFSSSGPWYLYYIFILTLNISRRYEVPLRLGMHNMFYVLNVHNKF